MNNEVFKGRDFLTIADFTPTELAHVLDVAGAQKRMWSQGNRKPLFQTPKAVAIVLQKPSLRTRISFEVACGRLGLQPIVMSGPDGAFSRGESVYDTAKVMERYVDAIVIRTFEQSLVEELALHANVPVINALTDDHHPCQGLADLLTVRERLGRLAGVRFAYIGDGNNMANTYLLAGAMAGMDVVVASPAGYQPSAAVVGHAQTIAEQTGGRVTVTTDPSAAVTGADVVVTDTWASMGQEAEHAARVAAFAGYCVDEAVMAAAQPSAIFLHCLPAHRGEEVTDAVIDSPQSAVFDEAENRLHVQKALLSLVCA
ncbi:MAG: ornithine carbamoyltransferase [Actinobacteria bacterium]|nr:MAG: ornithine carbamoyltransferase [Actinomycetota bacterium]